MKQEITRRFQLQPSDGVHCAQVLIYDSDDLEYWKDEVKRMGYLMAFDMHVAEDSFGYTHMAYDVFQIFPPEQADKFNNLKQVNLTT